MTTVNRLRMALLAVLVGLCGSLPVAAQDGRAAVNDTERQIQEMEQKLERANATRDVAAVAALYWDDLVDIHGSGWIYTKSQSMDLLRNRLATSSAGRKVIKSGKLDWKIVALGEGAGYATGINETYFEIPNPQTQAMEAGLLTRSPEAQAKADQRPAAAPGDGASTNLYRIRTVRVWVRRNGEWKIAVSQATRVGERLQPGR